MNVCKIICEIFCHSARSMDGILSAEPFATTNPSLTARWWRWEIHGTVFFDSFPSWIDKEHPDSMFLQFQFLAGSFLGPGFHSVSMDVTSLKPCDGLGIAAPFGSAWTHFTEEDDSDGSKWRNTRSLTTEEWILFKISWCCVVYDGNAWLIYNDIIVAFPEEKHHW